MEFFRDRDFHFGLDRKIPGSLKFGMKFLKFLTEIWSIFKNIRKNFGFYGFLTIGIFSVFSKNSGIFGKSSGFGFCLVSWFYSPGFGIFSLGIFIPGYSRFFKSQDFDPRYSGCFKPRDFNPWDSGFFFSLGILIPGIRDFSEIYYSGFFS